MNVVFSINGSDFSSKLAVYRVEREITYARVVTTMDNVEHAAGGHSRPIIYLSFWPLSEAEVATLYTALSGFIFSVHYTDPYTGTTNTGTFRLASDLHEVFALSSVDGNRYYKGGLIQLRGVE